ncbi:MAG: putative nuclease of restriction endonuclease-like (RecB) superfamily, family, partial [Daejeonella sp.]|nr:putative nuclease of restriction endonuclease-like (RecB) superfamily, family [Daejeonella sp.]
MNDKKYAEILSEIKLKIQEAQIKVIISANSQMLLLYCQLGNYILENQVAEGWGAKIIDSLSHDLQKEFPKIKGFSVRNLKYMRSFAASYPIEVIDLILNLELKLKENVSEVQQAVALLEASAQEPVIVQQAVAQLQEQTFLKAIICKLSWSHHVILLDKVKSLGQRFWYMLNSLEHGNSRNALAMQIESGLFHRQISAKKTTNFLKTLPEPQTDLAHYILKDPYIFDFVQAKEKADERDIEQQLTDHITKFLLELGQGFAFVGKQVAFQIGGTDYYTDLLFYHIRLHAYVVVELKARPFEPKDAGQLNFYVNVVNDKMKGPGDNDTI